jgi:geranylgeranylglycerol-phosphate geranylgeranyltransferase
MRAYLRLIRPPNSVMEGFAVVVGIVVASKNYHDIFSVTALLGFLTGFFLTSYSMISNDIYDLEVDKVNQPTRPLPSGAVKLQSAKYMSLLLLALGLLVSVPLGIANFIIALIFAVLVWYYNYQGKRFGLIGNSLVSLSLAVPYIYGSIAIGYYGLNLGYLLALTSFLAGMGREVLKGIADVKGDVQRKIRTLAISRGIKFSRVTVAAFFLLAVASSALPVLSGLLGKSLLVYSVLICIPDGIFLFLTVRVLLMKNESESLRLKSIALVGMMSGLLAYFIAGILG